MNDLILIKNRFNDLALRSNERGIYTYSEFLTIAEQSELNNMRFNVKYHLFGGYEQAERCIAVFGNENDLGYESFPPVVFVKIEPNQMKFSDIFTHRDFLGSLMGLGIKRSAIGDIIIKDNIAYVVCLDTISEYIISQLDKVKHTSVKCSLCNDVPEDVLPELIYEEHIVASERIDVLISSVYNLSRNESQKRIDGETVYCNSIVITNASFVPGKSAIISVRGCGRFIYDGILRTTKKGRNVIAVQKY